MRKIARKRILIPIATIAVLAIAGVAVAYFTSSGSGSGTASVGTDAGVTISPVTFDSTLYPGGSTTVHFTVNNSSSSSTVKVDQVVADTSAGTNGITGLPVGCSAADFHFAPASVGADIAASGSAAGTGTLSMDNTSANQDACKNASPVLHLKVDNSAI
jgi:hypothetical protein